MEDNASRDHWEHRGQQARPEEADFIEIDGQTQAAIGRSKRKEHVPSWLPIHGDKATVP